MNENVEPKLNAFRILNLSCSKVTKEVKDRVSTLALEPFDVLLSSYPKCDTKRIEIILWKLLRPQLDIPPIDKDSNRYLPCCEIVGSQQASMPRWKRPRLIKTYLSHKYIPSHSRAKYIYIFRNPFDTIANCYESLKQIIPTQNETFDDFLERFLRGDVGYGDYFDHVLSWYEQRKDENVLVLCHELIKSETRSALFSIAAFLGESFLQRLLNNEQEVSEIMHCVDAVTQKKNPAMCIKSFLNDQVFTTAQTVMIGNAIEQRLKKTGVDHLWGRIFKVTNTRLLQKDELTNVISKIELQLSDGI